MKMYVIVLDFSSRNYYVDQSRIYLLPSMKIFFLYKSEDLSIVLEFILWLCYRLPK